MIIDRNNPTNIRHSAELWNGEVPGTNIGDFAVFLRIADGYRAAMKNMQTYIKKYGLNTISQIITRWAPPSENPTAQYIQYVSSNTGIPVDATISANDLDSLSSMAYAMTFLEHNIASDDGTLVSAVNQAVDMMKSEGTTPVPASANQKTDGSGLLLAGLGLFLLSKGNKRGKKRKR